MLTAKIIHARWWGVLMLILVMMTAFGTIEIRSASRGQLHSAPGESFLRPHSEAADDDAGTSTKKDAEARVVWAKAADFRGIPVHVAIPKGVSDILGTQKFDVRQFEVVATGYYAGPESTGKDEESPEYGITYSGVRVRRDSVSTIAADPRVFPIGSLLYIPDYGYGIVADTGSAIKGNKIDLYFETKEQIYREWGKKRVKVLMIHKGRGRITEQMVENLNAAFARQPQKPAEM